MALTPSQQAAVLYDKDLILFAGPGSGKTSTSVAKGQRILENPDARLCMVTFTTSGAAEMRERMAAAFVKRGEALPTHRLTTGTFHSLMLRHFTRHGGTNQKLLSPPARSGMLNGMLADMDFETKGEYTLELEKYQGSMYPEQLTIKPEIAKFIAAYEARLKRINAIDLATAMRECVLGIAAGRIPYFPISHMIGDEMQDADQVQLELMLVHAKNGVVTTLVGDDDQTIYEWRSALGYEGLMKFAKATGAKTITLAENFRSYKEIVDVAQNLIVRNNPERIDKQPTAVRGKGAALGVVAASDLQQECANIARAIYRHRIDGETIGILGRNNRDLDAMELCLGVHQTDDNEPAAIPYHRDGQSIWDTNEVKTLLCLIQALIKGQTVDLTAVLGVMPLSAGSRASLEHAIGPSCSDFLDGVPVQRFQAESDEEAATIEELTRSTEFWRRKLRAGEIQFAMEGIVTFMGKTLKNQPKARANQIDGLMRAAGAVLGGLKGTLSERLATISRMQSKEPAPGVVRLMTMHSSKGLEFDLVFMLNATNPDNGSTLIEDKPERRLFYVGMTRAKSRLVISYSDRPVKYIAETGMKNFRAIEQILGGAT